MLLSDKQIKKLAIEGGMIDPFVDHLVQENDGAKVISYGASSYGVDVRLSPKEFKIFRHIPGTIVNPKRFNPGNLEPVDLQHSSDGDYFVLPGHSYGLCTTVERIDMPANITGLLLNKSTMVRCGVVLPATVIEAGWRGHITIEISNASSADVMLFSQEGIAQLLFYEGMDCDTNYKKRSGKYMDQPEQIVLAKV